VALTVQSTAWFAPGVGWVKLVNGGAVEDTQFTEVISLQSYSLP
jgi:hypothetical protein